MSTTGRSASSVRKPDDRRVSRTRLSIDKAFIALLEHRGYEAVGVSDIVREADVGRATFYEHYTSKDDLLRTQLRWVTNAMLRADPSAPGRIDATALFAHIRDVPVLYRVVAGRSAAVRSLRVLQDVMEERLLVLLREHLSAGASLRAPLTPPVAARVVTASLAALLAWWTEQGMATPPAQMQQLFQACVGPMLDPADAA